MTTSRFSFSCLATCLAFSIPVQQSFADELSDRAAQLRGAAQQAAQQAGPQRDALGQAAAQQLGPQVQQLAPQLQQLVAQQAAQGGTQQVNDLAAQVAEKLTPSQVTVAFGAGLNTAQPGNAANHHILPPTIRVRKGGVVTFQVAGFHQVIVYKPGTRAENVGVPTTGLFVNAPDTLPLPSTLFYRGIKPAGGPPPGFPVTTDPSNASNRAESVSFAEPGTYLVICNVAQHFRDGMYAYVEVK